MYFFIFILFITIFQKFLYKFFFDCHIHSKEKNRMFEQRYSASWIAIIIIFANLTLQMHVTKNDNLRMVTPLYISAASNPYPYRKLNSPKLYRFQYSLSGPDISDMNICVFSVLSLHYSRASRMLDPRAIITPNAGSAKYFLVVLTVTVIMSRVECANRKVDG